MTARIENDEVYPGDGHTIVALITTAPGDEGTAYTLTLQDGRQARISENEPEYHQIAAIIDGAFGDYHATAKAAGYDVVADVLDALKNRETVSEIQLNKLDEEAIERLYQHVDRAIDAIEAAIVTGEV
jgi:hypothetical protein